MAKARSTHQAPVFIPPPSRMVWDDEKLASLDKEQLTNLLNNLHTQLAIGRITEATASELEGRILSRLPKATVARLKQERDGTAGDSANDADTEAE